MRAVIDAAADWSAPDTERDVGYEVASGTSGVHSPPRWTCLALTLGRGPGMAPHAPGVLQATVFLMLQLHGRVVPWLVPEDAPERVLERAQRLAALLERGNTGYSTRVHAITSPHVVGAGCRGGQTRAPWTRGAQAPDRPLHHHRDVPAVGPRPCAQRPLRRSS